MLNQEEMQAKAGHVPQEGVEYTDILKIGIDNLYEISSRNAGEVRFRIFFMRYDTGLAESMGFKITDEQAADESFVLGAGLAFRSVFESLMCSQGAQPGIVYGPIN